MTVLRILFGAAFVWFFCLASGQLFFRAIRLTLRAGESTFLGFVTGASLVGTLMFLLASGRLVYTRLLVVVGLAVIGAWLRICRPVHRRAPRDPEDEAPLPLAWRIAFWLPLIVYGCLYLMAALAPETSADGTVYHLGLIARYYDYRGFMAMPHDMFAGLPEGIEMLFWIGFSLGRHSAAAMVHLLFLLAMPFGMLAFARRIGQPKAGVVAALLFYMAPIAGKDATIAYVDTGTAVVVFAAFYCLWLWRKTECQAALIPAGLLAGYCYACKMSAGMAIPFAIVFVIVGELARGRGKLRALRSGAVAALLACVIAVPWMLKNLILFHNPFFPLMNHLFPNPHLYPLTEDELRRIFINLNKVPLRDFPFQIAVGGKFVGILGPVFLLAPMALLSLRFPAGRLCLLAFVVFFPPFFGNTEVRFLLPSLPFLALAIAMALLSIPHAGAALGLIAIAFHSYTSWPGVVQQFVPGFQWRIELPDIRVPLRIVSEQAWFSEHWHEYDVGLMLDRFVPPGDSVFSPNMGAIAYHHRDLVGSFDSALGLRIFDLYLTPLVDIWANGWRRDIRFAPVTTRRIRLQSTSDMDNELRIHELRFYDGDTEIPRRPDWRLTASRNPWEVQFAFDNDRVSWWTSGQRVDRRTWIEADFPRPVRIDRLGVDQIEDQRWIQLSPSADLNGRWTMLQAQETAGPAPRRPDLRMAVRDELKAAGIRWMLIQDGAYGADDIRNKSPYWGITQIAEVHGYRLWKLN